MDTVSAFARGDAARDANAQQRVFDWDQAARRIAELRPRKASAGLRDDWEWTGGLIWRGGKPVDADKTYTYLSSNWAIPELDLDGDIEECWGWAEDLPDCDEHSYWPDSARAIIAQVGVGPMKVNHGTLPRLRRPYSPVEPAKFCSSPWVWLGFHRRLK